MHVVLLVVYGFEMARNWNNNRSNIHFPSLQLSFNPGCKDFLGSRINSCSACEMFQLCIVAW